MYFKEQGTPSEKACFSKKHEALFKLLPPLLGKLTFYNVYFEGEDLDSLDVSKHLKECLVVLGDLIVESPDIELSADMLEKRFQTLYGIPFHTNDYKDHVMAKDKFQANLIKEFPTIKEMLQGLDNQLQELVVNTAFKFIKTAVIELKYWLPDNEPELFDIGVVYFERYDPAAWDRLKTKLANLLEGENEDEFEAQVKSLRYSFVNLQTERIITKCSPLRIWQNNQTKFPLLYKLARGLIVTPYSSCPLERTFSKCTDIKTIKRNRLSLKCLEGCLLIKQKYGEKLEGLTPHKLAALVKKAEGLKHRTSANLYSPVVQPPSHQTMELEFSNNQDDFLPLDKSPCQITQQVASVARKVGKTLDEFSTVLDGTMTMSHNITGKRFAQQPPEDEGVKMPKKTEVKNSDRGSKMEVDGSVKEHL